VPEDRQPQWILVFQIYVHRTIPVGYRGLRTPAKIKCPRYLACLCIDQSSLRVHRKRTLRERIAQVRPAPRLNSLGHPERRGIERRHALIFAILVT
jgi:hypothetical protein